MSSFLEYFSRNTNTEETFPFQVIFLIVAAIVAVIIGITERNKSQENSANTYTPKYDNGFVIKEPIAQYMAKNVPDFNERLESLRVAEFLEMYITAIGTKPTDFSDFNEYCSKGVITELCHDIATTKVNYRNPKVTSVKFTDYIIAGNELTLICNAMVDYTAGEKDNLFEAKYALKYSRILREANARHSLTCPHCGAPISDKSITDKVCEFCGGDLNAFLNATRTWTIVNIDRLDNRLKYIPK